MSRTVAVAILVATLGGVTIATFIWPGAVLVGQAIFALVAGVVFAFDPFNLRPLTMIAAGGVATVCSWINFSVALLFMEPWSRQYAANIQIGLITPATFILACLVCVVGFWFRQRSPRRSSDQP